MSKMVLLAAILYLPFEIRTFWQPSWIYHLKSGLFGGHFVFTIWKPNFFVRISNGKCKMAAKNNIIDIYVRFSNAICKPTYFPPFEILTCPDFRSPLYIPFVPKISEAADFLMSSCPSFDFPSARPRNAERMAARMLMLMASGLETVVEVDELDWEAVGGCRRCCPKWSSIWKETSKWRQANRGLDRGLECLCERN